MRYRTVGGRIVERGPRSMTPPGQPQERLEGDPPAVTDEARAYVEQQIGQCRARSETQWKLKVALAIAIVGAFGTIVTAGVSLIGKDRQAELQAKTDDKREKALASILSRLTDLEQSQRAARDSIEALRTDLRRRIAARPLQRKDPDIITPD